MKTARKIAALICMLTLIICVTSSVSAARIDSYTKSNYNFGIEGNFNCNASLDWDGARSTVSASTSLTGTGDKTGASYQTYVYATFGYYGALIGEPRSAWGGSYSFVSYPGATHCSFSQYF